MSDLRELVVLLADLCSSNPDSISLERDESGGVLSIITNCDKSVPSIYDDICEYNYTLKEVTDFIMRHYHSAQDYFVRLVEKVEVDNPLYSNLGKSLSAIHVKTANVIKDYVTEQDNKDAYLVGVLAVLVDAERLEESTRYFLPNNFHSYPILKYLTDMISKETE